MNRQVAAIMAAAVALTVPWVGAMLLGAVPASSLGTVVVSGLAVLGASFLLAWAAETAEKDVPRAFAIAVLAVLAVAPEYAVDALYAWQAGAGGATPAQCAQLTAAEIEAQATALARGCHAGNLAVANMTGANRILIGLGWSGIALFTIFRSSVGSDPSVEQKDGLLADAVQLDHGIGLEIVFLFLATLWAFAVPLFGGIDLLDMVVLVGLYVAYIVIILKGDVETHEEHVGVPAYLQQFSTGPRVLTVLGLFSYSGLLILTAVEPFAHGLESLGTAVGIPPFFMIQWIAPLASESPELIVVAYLVNKARTTAGFNALISSKLNQWTLLIGTLVVVYSLALGQYGVLPFDSKQVAEIWLTAAQSYFALSLLVNFEISAREAVGLLVLFASQVFLEFLIVADLASLPLTSYQLLIAFTAVYVVLGTALFAGRRRALKGIVLGAANTTRDALFGREEATAGAD